MGTDIHLLAERQTDNGWEVVPGDMPTRIVFNFDS